MTCDELRDDEFEAYLAGGLADAEMTRVELHVFDCSICFDRLETLRAARVVLARPAPRRVPWWQTQTFAIAASLVAIVAVGGVARLVRGPAAPTPAEVTASADNRAATAPVEAAPAPAAVDVQGEAASPTTAVTSEAPPPAPRPSRPRDAAADALRKLAGFTAPPVLALTVRSADQADDAVSDGLSAALRAYVQGDYASADQRFRTLEAAERDLAAVQFFSGVAALKTGKLADARRALEAAADGDHATSAVEAWLYLAHAALAAGDGRRAVAALDRYIELEGDRVIDARRLRGQVLAVVDAR